MPIDQKEAELRIAALGRVHKIENEEIVKFFEKSLNIEFGYQNWYWPSNCAPQIGKAFRELGAIRRSLFLRSLQGKLGSALNKALETAPELPYQFGDWRVPFRSPKEEELSDRNRGLILLAAFKMTREYDQPASFFSEWIGYIEPGSIMARCDLILAGAIDAGDKASFDILAETLRGKHPIGVICRTTIRALLLCHRPEAWTEVERLLISAQREEGLRQTIFESVDELNPKVFPRFVRLVIEHNLLRFSSVIRAFAVWFPGMWRDGDAKSGAKVLGRLLEFFTDKGLKPAADAADVYLRLWSFAFEDIALVTRKAETYVASTDPAIRRTTVRILLLTRVSTCFPLLRIAVRDPDRTVASIAVEAFSQFDGETLANTDLKSLLSPIASSWPKSKTPELVDRSRVWDLVFKATPEKQIDQLASVIHEMSPLIRARIARLLPKVIDARKRKKMALALIGDTSPDVRSTAMTALEKTTLTAGDAVVIEDLLRRKAADLRKSALKLLRNQSPEEALASGERLLASKERQQRLAGLELLVELATVENSVDARNRVSEYAGGRVLDELEENLTKRLKPSSAQPLSLDDGFGLYKIEQLTFCDCPPSTGVTHQSDSAITLLLSLDSLIHEHRNETISYSRWFYDGRESPDKIEATVGDLGNSFARPKAKMPYETDRLRFPIAYLIEPWTEARSLESGDAHGPDVIRAYLTMTALTLRLELNRDLAGYAKLKGELRYLRVIDLILPWIVKSIAPQTQTKSLIDMLSERVAALEKSNYVETNEAYRVSETSWRSDLFITEITKLLLQNLQVHYRLWQSEDFTRLYRILRYVDEPLGVEGRSHVAKLRAERFAKERLYEPWQWENRSNFKPEIRDVPPRRTCPFPVLVGAYAAGACNRYDVLDQLGFWGESEHQYVLRTATRRGRLSNECQDIAEEFVARLVEIESTRGELPTPASDLVLQAKSGIYLPQVRLLLSKNVALTARSSETSRASVFTKMFSVSRPRLTEAPEFCSAAFREDRIHQERLLELAMFAPQWSAAVELATGWEGLSNAVWWIHAHTKDEHWSLETEIKEIWKGEISERTPLSGEDLVQGAVDVAWFKRFRSCFDDKRWKQLENLTKFASSGAGHTRAKLFAQAMDGNISPNEMTKRIEEKRTPDAVRALGLVPLEEDHEADVRRRYATMQEFLRTSRQFGSMRQASEKLAVRIGLENLARTAGYPDPLRLTWALEAREVEDLKNGGKSVSSGDVQVRLYFDPQGDPQIEVQKNGQPLKDIPAATKKLPEIKELTERRASLKKQALRMRIALEQAMQRGDKFESDEVRKLFEHPGLAPMLRNLVFIGDSGQAGFLDEKGRLAGESGNLFIAHPFDLLSRGDWPEWQHLVFKEERVQPFKQVFRELYTLTAEERTKVRSTRYAGHQLQPRQALAILGKREWVLRAEDGVSRTIHEVGLTARLSFEENFYTPADVEGLTLEALRFTKAGTWQDVPLADVPPKAFSETMRDLDLIVSVASMTGIDPEASESTVEMRASVVRELSLLMRLGNVSLNPRHVIVRGKLGEYSIHLGSGVVHQRTKGELVILAVRQPQRGRLFLPFMDDDPRTAEIASKVLLLARDDQIKDPTILSQIVQIE